ncbi:MAG TPA: Yip1 family protein [Xanthobacteraceae bacterium]|nr:Yip1 family protein [Xanthobacteraceae bacterium]
MNVMLRVKSILSGPLAEWELIERDTEDPAYILTRYVALLAIIPSLFGFIGASLIGVIARDGATLRTPMVDGLFSAIFGYVMACAIVLIVALFIYVLAPIFGGRRGFDNAFKLAVYSFTPVWLAGIFLLLPGLHFLVLFSLYGLYLLRLGAPPLVKVPDAMALTFAIAIAACAGALVYAAVTAQHVIFATPGM